MIHDSSKEDGIKEIPIIIFHNDNTRQIAMFNETNGELSTASKFKQKDYHKYILTGKIGKQNESKNFKK
jgi:hypothetical protein